VPDELGAAGCTVEFSGDTPPGNAAKNSLASFASIAGSGAESGTDGIKPETP